MSSDCSHVSIPLSVYVSLFAHPLLVAAGSASVSLTPVRLLAAFRRLDFLAFFCLFACPISLAAPASPVCLSIAVVFSSAYLFEIPIPCILFFLDLISLTPTLLAGAAAATSSWF